MNARSALLPASRQPPFTFGRLLVVYATLTLLPYLWSLTQDLAYRGVYTTIVTILNLTGLAALLAQSLLSGRIDAVTRYAGIDNGMRLHRQVGELVGIYFFLHPLLIVLPRYMIAPQRANADLWTSLTASESATGLYALCLMAVWVLMAKYREKLRISYEAWRITHGVGLVAVAILAAHHAVTVGRHGRYDPWFDVLWIMLCALAVGATCYTYFVRPMIQKGRPFKIIDVCKAGASDWSLTIEKDGHFNFAFDAGQFVWLNTSGNPFNRSEHPFSIASSPSDPTRLSFVIRELGDYTRNISELRIGQRVFVDGPHGVFTLVGRKAEGIALIAGGAGIGPILGLLRQLRDLGETRPVRLVYGNRSYDQMVFQKEILQTETSLRDFRQLLVLERTAEGIDGYVGVIDRNLLEKTFPASTHDTWLFYVCGPPVMVNAVADHLAALGVPAERVLFERLAF